MFILVHIWESKNASCVMGLELKSVDNVMAGRTIVAAGVQVVEEVMSHAIGVMVEVQWM